MQMKSEILQDLLSNETNKKRKEQVTVRSSAAEYLNYVACVGDDKDTLWGRKDLAYTEVDGYAVWCGGSHY